MSEAFEPTLSYAAYLEAERAADRKHEFVAGEVYARAGGTIEHNRIASQALLELGVALRGRPCRAINSDQRLRIADADMSCYPDVTIVCGDDLRADDDDDALTNPTVVLEVLSPSTEAHDRGAKFAALRTLPSLQQFVLLHQARRQAEVFTRSDDGSWHLTFHSERLPLSSLDIEVDLAAVYEGVELADG